jgi:hypothetical protein
MDRARRVAEWPIARRNQHEIISAREVEERQECFERSAVLRNRQRQHAGRAAEAHRRNFVHVPALGSDFNGPPAQMTAVHVASMTLARCALPMWKTFSSR